MGVGLLILYVWAQPTVDRRPRKASAGATRPVETVTDAELELYEPELDETETTSSSTADEGTSTLDAKAPSEE
jgi:hypothetical protein